MGGASDHAVESDPDDGPERSCIVTRRKGPPDELIRFVLSPERAVVADIRCRLPGRGAWVMATRESVREAVRRKCFARAFKTELSVSPGLADEVEALLERDALQALAMANKAGVVLAGAFKIEAAAGGAQPIAVLVHALEGSPGGRRKIEAAIRRRIGDAADRLERVQIFESAQLDLALGRTNVIHAAVAGGTAADGFASRSRRLERYRGAMRTAPADPA